MYIYFDYSGNLKEIVSYPVRQGDDNSKTIYVYVESSANPQMSDDMYKLPANITAASIAFKLVDTDENLGNLNAMTKVSTGLEIPYDKTRDLKYFKYWKKYQFWKYTLQSAQTVANGVVAATVTLSDTVESKDYVLDTFAFNVQASVGIIPDSSLNYSQYQYLFSRITALENAENVFVPYTGADDNVDLGNHYLKTSSYINIQGALYNTYIDSRGINITAEDYDFTLDFPVSTNQSETIATQEWVGSQDYLTEHQSLAGLVPYSNASNDVDLGTHDILARYLKSGTSSKYTELEPTGIRSINLNYVAGFSFLQFPDTRASGQSTGSDYIATRKETKLYRHIVQVADYGHSDYVTLVIISKSGNGVQTLDELGDAIPGFVSGFYEDEHSLIYPLLECSVNLTVFGFAYIDENHEFWDATWNSAIVSNDIVEEI